MKQDCKIKLTPAERMEEISTLQENGIHSLP